MNSVTCLKPHPPEHFCMYRQLASLLGWKFRVNIFCVLISGSSISPIIQSNTPIVGIRTDTAKALWAITLLYALRSEDHIFFVPLKYSLKTLY